LEIVHIISKFIAELKAKTAIMRYNLMTERIFNIYGDHSADFNELNLRRNNQTVNIKLFIN